MTTVPVGAHPSVTPSQTPAALDWRALAPSLCVFFLISYLIAVALHLLFPGSTQFSALVGFLRMENWNLTWLTFISGVIECMILGCYTAIVFSPIYGAFAKVVHACDRRSRLAGA